MSLIDLTFDIISAVLMGLLDKNQPERKKTKSGHVYFEWPLRFLIRAFAWEEMSEKSHILAECKINDKKKDQTIRSKRGENPWGLESFLMLGS